MCNGRKHKYSFHLSATGSGKPACIICSPNDLIYPTVFFSTACYYCSSLILCCLTFFTRLRMCVRRWSVQQKQRQRMSALIRLIRSFHCRRKKLNSRYWVYQNIFEFLVYLTRAGLFFFSYVSRSFTFSVFILNRNATINHSFSVFIV